MITLLSDFGGKDIYVAVMKGAIASIAPDVVTCDLTHAIAPQNVLAARFALMMAYSYFPVGTVHLAVVDPGVGSARRAVAVQYADGFLVGPDNGLFSGVLANEPVVAAVALTNADYWRSPTLNHQPNHQSNDSISHTFHGRDIFAPVAAHLANGVPIDVLGDRIDPTTLVQPQLPPFAQFLQPSQPKLNIDQTLCAGSIQYIDGFGNLISNIPRSAVPLVPWQIELETSLTRHRLPSAKTYGDVSAGELLALVGSHGWVEIACSCGSAAAALESSGGVCVGTPVKLRLSPDMP